MWVVVDLSKPDVQVEDVKLSINGKAQQVDIRWKATDKNMSRQPITLSYAEKEAGPWSIIATNVENNGQYTWPVPADAPSKFLVRVEATDLAGNVGRWETREPIPLEAPPRPKARVLGVTAGRGH